MSGQAAQRVQQLVDGLLKTRLADVGNPSEVEGKLRELHVALAEVSTFADGIGKLLGQFAPTRRGPGRPAKTPAGAQAPSPPRSALRPRGSRRGRAKGGIGEFAATSFILDAVQAAGAAGVRPRDIVEKVVAAAPGHHAKPSALVSTTLRRLKDQGKVTKRRGGKWVPAAE